MYENLDTAALFNRICFLPHFLTRYPRSMQLFGNHGVTHPTGERQSPGSVDSEEEQKVLEGPESAAGSLDVVGFD